MRTSLSLSLALALLAPAALRADEPVAWGDTIRPGAAVWIRLLPPVEPDGPWIAVRTEFRRDRPTRLVVAHSADRCRTWTDVGSLEQTARNLDNGMLFSPPVDPEHPTRILLACRSVAVDKSSGRLLVFRSDDQGRTWADHGQIDASEVEPGQIFGLGLWEPFLYTLPDGRLACAYATERHAQANPPYSQICAIRTSTDAGATWSDQEHTLTAEPGGGKLRPGMPVVTRLPDGSFVAVYEIVGIGDAQIFVKRSADGLAWPDGLGQELPGHRAGPYVITLPSGRLLATSCSARLSYSDDGGRSWTLADRRGWIAPADPERTHLTWPALFHLGGDQIALTNSSLGPTSYEIRFGTLLPEP